MKKFILSLIILTLAVASGGAQEKQKKKWSAQIGLMNSWLIDQDVIAGYGIDDYFDTFGVGFNMKVNHDFTDLFSLGFGYNAVTFEQDSWTSFENLSDLEVSATYLSFEFRGAAAKQVEAYGSIELGVSDLSDVDYDFPAFGIAGLNMYESDSTAYWSLGGGVKIDLDKDVFLDVAYRYRHYGSLKRNATNFTALIEDVDIATSNLDIAIGFRF